MGSIYQSLTRNMNLEPLANAVKGMIYENRRKKKLENFINTMDKFRGDMGGLYADKEQTDYSVGQTPQTSLAKLKQTPRVQLDGSPVITGQPNIPEDTFEPQSGKLGMLRQNPQLDIPVEKPDPFKLSDIGDVTARTTTRPLNQEELQQANRQADDKVVDFILQGLQNEIEPEQITQGTQMLQLLKQGRQPAQMQTQIMKPGETMVGKYPDGSVKPIYSLPKGTNIEEYERDADGNIIIHKIGGQDWMRRISKKEDGSTSEKLERVPKQGEGKTTVNVEDSTPELRIHSNVGTLTELNDNWDYFDRIANDPKQTPEDRKNATEQKNVYMGKIKGITDELTSQLNDKIPGFEGTLNLLYQEIGDDKSKIDSTVEDKLKGKNPDTIRYMKKILHSRIRSAKKEK